MKKNEFYQSFKAIACGEFHLGAVVYIDLGKEGFDFFPELGRPIIFAGLTSNWRESTINSAEEIVAKISQQEGINIGIAAGNATERDFYDLQVCKGYGHIKPGQFELNKLTIKSAFKPGGFEVTGWEVVKNVPENFEFFFSGLIEQTINA